MSPEKDEELCKKYPILYTDRNAPMSKTCMCWGFEIGDGWYGIIDKLSATLEGFNNEMKQSGSGTFIIAAQVKEKFGGLRFYIEGVPNEYADKVWAAIDQAENESYKTCENCSKPGKSRGGGWIKVLCDDCCKPKNEHEKVSQ